jgi:S-adenosylmethionine uptake transporter
MQSLWMVVAAALFALMSALVKLAAARYGVAEIMFYRGLIGTLVLFGFALAGGLSLRTTLPWTHFRRSVIGGAAQMLWFFATTMLPVATALMLNYTAPLWVAAFSIGAALLSRKRVDWPLAATIVAGFAGVALVLQPGFAGGQGAGGVLGLASGLLSALAYWHVRDLGRRGEPEWRIVFYFSLTSSLLGLFVALPFGLSAHTLPGLSMLAGVGVSATLAQLAMTRAYSRGPTLLTANLQYSAVIFASMLGGWLFGDRIGANGWIGIALIVAAAIGATLVRAAHARAALAAGEPAAAAPEPSTPCSSIR